jgi:hypothetical protein
MDSSFGFISIDKNWDEEEKDDKESWLIAEEGLDLQKSPRNFRIRSKP